MRLVVKIEAVRDQLFDINLRRAFATAVSGAAIPARSAASFASAITAAVTTTRTTGAASIVAARSATRAAILTWRAIFTATAFFSFLLFSLRHVLFLSARLPLR